ncbi:MAG TPA: glycosyltransferase family 39 protein, partial [Bacteroidia bacterium]|nr:glycosyltransferase family 39 protein [Bacteroidia bacterium]
MSNPLSRYAVLLIAIILFLFRFQYLPEKKSSLNVTTWDAFGYYMYLPATFIYHDTRELKWLPDIDKKYNVTGGKLYQANIAKNGKYVFKYLGGVSIIQIPFFLFAHAIAHISGAPADGFSWPYQYCLAFGAILWALFGIILLRKILLRFFNDRVTAITLLLLLLASNFIQYASVDNAMSHIWIFPLYPLAILATIRWHENPSRKLAFFIGAIIGLAIISRPTEGVMLFIPLFWNTHSKEEAKKKWALVKQNKSHFIFLAIGGLAGILPQLIYWKYASGHFVYDVGSKWVFANPYFRVLFGWEKGWFIYTPVAILMVLGFFFMKNFPFRKSVLIFCLLNIWIIIAWSDWRYGASYSCRAMVQSYPVFALTLAAFLARMEKNWQKISLYAIGIYLIGVNLFQIVQYNKTILHYNDMNRAY